MPYRGVSKCHHGHPGPRCPECIEEASPILTVGDSTGNNTQNVPSTDACDISRLGECQAEGEHVPLEIPKQHTPSQESLVLIQEPLVTDILFQGHKFANMMLCRRCGLVYWEPAKILKDTSR